MIKIIIDVDKKDNYIKQIEIKGHADYSKNKPDILCAGISALSEAIPNALIDNNAYKLKIDDGYYLLKVIKEISSHDKIVLEVMQKAFERFKEDYPNYIDIKVQKD